MSGITSGVGLFSGINTGSLIEQLLAVDARPKALAQNRITQLQLQSAAYLDLNSRLGALRSASKAFKDNNVFQTKKASSSDETILKATAQSSAAAGSYSFIVDKLVSSQQLLSRGFIDRDSASVGVTSVSFETAKARLDNDVNLAELNDGSGVSRGKITVTDSGNRTTTIDLSRATTVNEVLEAINSNGTAQVTASVRGGRFVIKDANGGTVSIANVGSGTTASSLGIDGTATGEKVGSIVYRLNGSTSLNALNDGNGVSVRNDQVGTDTYQFSIKFSGNYDATVKVNIGDVYEDVTTNGTTTLTKTKGAVTSVQGVLDRVNAALQAQGATTATASIDQTSGKIVITDTDGADIEIIENGGKTAADLGLSGTGTGVVTGKRIFGGLNTTLLKTLNGGQGVTGDGVLNFTARDGTTSTVTIDKTGTLSEAIAQINAATGGKITAKLNTKGTGLLLTDTTTGTGNLIVTGTSGNDTATSLGISTGAAGVTNSSVTSGNLQKQYLSDATTLSSLNNGKGLGTGKIRITDPTGESRTITINENVRTVGDLIRDINRQGLKVTAKINSTGDGIEVAETDTGSAGAVKLQIEDVEGSVGKSLGIAGTATGVGTANKLVGSLEKKVSFSAADTLATLVTKINEAGVGVTAAIIRDGNGASPFRLSLVSQQTGVAGRFIVDSIGADLGISTLDAGSDARVFFGSTDPAKGVAITSSTNTVDDAISGVKIDLVTADPTKVVNLTVSRDTAAVESAMDVFVKSFNTLNERIKLQTKYDKDTDKGGPLLGDSTAQTLQRELYTLVQGRPKGVTGRYGSLSDIGVKIGAGGALELDTEKLRNAIATDPGSVESLLTTKVLVDDKVSNVFSGDSSVTVRNVNSGSSYSSLGMMAQIELLGDRYLSTVNGILTNRSKNLSDQVTFQSSRIDSMNARLERKRAVYEKQFAAMESTLAKLNQQSSSLSSISKAG